MRRGISLFLAGTLLLSQLSAGSGASGVCGSTSGKAPHPTSMSCFQHAFASRPIQLTRDFGVPSELGFNISNTDSPSGDGGLELKKRKDPLTFVGEVKSGYATATSSTQTVTYATPEVKPTPTLTQTKTSTPNIRPTLTALPPILSSKHSPMESLNRPEEKPPPVATTSKSDSSPSVIYSPQEKSTPVPSTTSYEVLAPIISVASSSSTSSSVALNPDEIIGIQKGSPSTTVNLIGIHSE